MSEYLHFAKVQGNTLSWWDNSAVAPVTAGINTLVNVYIDLVVITHIASTS